MTNLALVDDDPRILNTVQYAIAPDGHNVRIGYGWLHEVDPSAKRGYIIVCRIPETTCDMIEDEFRGHFQYSIINIIVLK